MQFKPEMLDNLEDLEARWHLIHHGDPDQALQAAKGLGFNPVLSVPGSPFLEQDGTIRAMMKVSNAVPPCSIGQWFPNHSS